MSASLFMLFVRWLSITADIFTVFAGIPSGLIAFQYLMSLKYRKKSVNIKWVNEFDLLFFMLIKLYEKFSFLVNNVFISATRRRREIKIPLCLSAPVWKS